MSDHAMRRQTNFPMSLEAWREGRLRLAGFEQETASQLAEDVGREDDTLLRALLGPEGPELTCEECFEQLDRYVELELAGSDADEAIPGMRAHLEGCPACHDDHDSFRSLMKATLRRID